MKKIRRMMPTLLMLTAFLATAAEQAGNRKDYFDRLQMKAEMKSLLRSSMNNYFDPATFLIDLQLAFAEVTPDRYILPEMHEDIVIAELPGAPFIRIPRFSATETELQIAERNQPEGIRAIDRIHLTIYVENSYLPDELSFMRMLAARILQLNTDAGDAINIYQIDMPRNPLPENHLEHPVKTEFIAEDLTRSGINWLWVIVGLAILMIALLILNLLKKRTTATQENLRLHTEKVGGHAASGISADVSRSTPSNNINSENKNSGNIDNDYLFVTTCLVKHTNDLALLFDTWMNRNEQEGANKIARIINMTDPRYLSLFKGLVSDCSYSAIEAAMQEPDNRCMETDHKQIGELAADLKRFLFSGDTKGISTFQFLHFMDNDALQALCHKLDPAELSILMDNLPDEKVSELFERLGPDIATSIITINARRKRLDFKQVDTLAERCFAFFRKHKAGKEYNSGNLDRLTRLLEELHIDKQEQFLKSIRTGDSELHRTIHGRMLTWKKLTGMESHVLKTALATTDSRTLAFAFADAESAMKEKTLSLRSKREQLLIRDLMSEAATIPNETKEKAKQTILKTVRKHLQPIDDVKM